MHTERAREPPMSRQCLAANEMRPPPATNAIELVKFDMTRHKCEVLTSSSWTSHARCKAGNAFIHLTHQTGALEYE
jgi:hypothetical protein